MGDGPALAGSLAFTSNARAHRPWGLCFEFIQRAIVWMCVSFPSRLGLRLQVSCLGVDREVDRAMRRREEGKVRGRGVAVHCSVSE